jgi:putative transposase
MEEGKFYHIFNRGNNHEKIFYEEANYKYFLHKFDKYLSGFIDVFAYCLMPNHFHILGRVKPPDPDFIINHNCKTLSPLEKAFKDFLISYSKSINKRYHRTGSLFQYKYKRKEIVNDSYLKRVICYIHFNPVVAGHCNKCHEWKYSSFNVFTGNKSTKIKKDEVIKLFDNLENFIFVHQSKYKDYSDINDLDIENY